MQAPADGVTVASYQLRAMLLTDSPADSLRPTRLTATQAYSFAECIILPTVGVPNPALSGAVRECRHPPWWRT
jgi:hypothetical protein